MAEHNQRFETFDEWCNKASSWLTRHPEFSEKHFRAICFDSKGRICRMGSDFMKAEFPVHWVWPDQNLFEAVQNTKSATVESANKAEAILRQCRRFIAAENEHARLLAEVPEGGTSRDEVDILHADLTQFTDADFEAALRVVSRRRTTLAPATDTTPAKNPA